MLLSQEYTNINHAINCLNNVVMIWNLILKIKKN